MHFMGELVLHRTQVEVARRPGRRAGPLQAMQDLTRCSHALQAMVMQVRMIPVEAVFLRFPRLVRDLSTKLGKQVELELVGKDTELDRTVVDALGDPLVHLSATRSTTASRRPRSASRPASRADRHAARSPPATPAATSSSRSATTAAASTPQRRPPRPPSAG